MLRLSYCLIRHKAALLFAIMLALLIDIFHDLAGSREDICWWRFRFQSIKSLVTSPRGRCYLGTVKATFAKPFEPPLVGRQISSVLGLDSVLAKSFRKDMTQQMAESRFICSRIPPMIPSFNLTKKYGSTWGASTFTSCVRP